MGIILNDAKAKWKTDKSLLETFIENSPISDREFDEIIEAYETDEDTAMDIMINCSEGQFTRNPEGNGWNFEPANPPTA